MKWIRNVSPVRYELAFISQEKTFFSGASLFTAPVLNVLVRPVGMIKRHINLQACQSFASYKIQPAEPLSNLPRKGGGRHWPCLVRASERAQGKNGRNCVINLPSVQFPIGPEE
jgi:hypothetical protein